MDAAFKPDKLAGSAIFCGNEASNALKCLK
jgi:hypothetical protein